ncbi:hypothetical protein [Thiohalorhabdus methylotrophus]|uniref:Phosphate-selective porin O and P n=1 Tax=Thiohalorhabdus methylotrophus TaxID=3242694 RepID=A0ABV4TWU9_9GAMM
MRAASWTLFLAGGLVLPLLSGPAPAQTEGKGRSAEGEHRKEDLAEELESQERRMEELRAELESLESMVPGTNGAEADMPEEPPIRIGGALRLNYSWLGYAPGSRERGGDLGLELFRLNVDGTKNGVEFSAEYRWYPYLDAVHHGWAGFPMGEAGTVRAGIMRVPFGLLPYAAHNYWFGVPYFMGFADDYDAGVQYLHKRGPLDVRAAFFKNAELGNPANLERYSIDVVQVPRTPANNAKGDLNRESNQANVRLAYTLGAQTACSTELGISGQAGALYNADTGKSGERWAAAGHLDLRCGRWNLQLEGFRYAFSPENPAGIGDETITVGGLASSYPLATRGTVGVLNVAYNVPVQWGRIDLLTCYNDFSILAKDADGFRDSKLNTTGCAVGSGPLFVYLDLIQAQNMVFFGGDGSLGAGGSRGWDTRLNLNLGYYF